MSQGGCGEGKENGDDGAAAIGDDAPQDRNRAQDARALGIEEAFPEDDIDHSEEGGEESCREGDGEIRGDV